MKERTRHLIRDIRLGLKRWIWRRYGRTRWYVRFMQWNRTWRISRRVDSGISENRRLVELSWLARNSRSTPATGSSNWLIQTEIKYGGYSENVSIEKLSEHDRRNIGGIDHRPNTGGDRMLHHDYAKHYARFLAPYVGGGTRTNRNLRGRGAGGYRACDLVRPVSQCARDRTGH